MQVTVTAPGTHLCPYVDERDHGAVHITWTDDAPDLHVVAEFLDSLANTKITHEEYTRRVAGRYPDATVTTTWTTAGMRMECSTSPPRPPSPSATP